MLKLLLHRGLWFVNVGWLFRRRARSRKLRDKTFLLFEGRRYTYREALREATRFALYFRKLKAARVAAGALKPTDQLRVGLYQQNTPDFVFAVLGASLEGALAFGINTGFRGDTLRAVLDRSGVQLLLADAHGAEELGREIPNLERLRSEDLLWVDGTDQAIGRPLTGALAEVEMRDPASIRWPRIDNFSSLLVIYTSGTTGPPKAVACSHMKLVGCGYVVTHRVGLHGDDRAYCCMPLFHSNAWFLAIMPMIRVGGSVVLTPKFSASRFSDDLLGAGITYMNYVGQPIHYILHALEERWGGPDGVEAALAKDPRNRFRCAHGNGATAADRARLVRYLGMEHIFELYGSTEAAISTFIKPGDPLDSVGGAPDSVVILDEQGEPCPPGIADANGRLTNYAEAVGEISRRMPRDNIYFDGYLDDDAASNKKYRDGCFRSGDLGHIRVVGGKRFLYFNGRTDDWIRKDGENFSAQSVTGFAHRLPDAALVAAYGVPHPIADEHVMLALQLKSGATFDPQATFDRYLELQKTGGMDPKWMPDFIRIVERFPMTTTQKIVVRPLKAAHFDLDAHPDMEVYFRERGDTTYRKLTPEAYQARSEAFAAAGREAQLATN